MEYFINSYKNVKIYVDLQTLLSEPEYHDEMSFLWRNLADFLLQPMFDLQSIMMMYIALDRYASLYVVSETLWVFCLLEHQHVQGYWPFAENRKRLAYFLIAPLVFAFILMSSGIHYLILPFESFIYARWPYTSVCININPNYFRLALLLLPSAISFLLLSVCLVIKKERLNYDPGFSISLSKWVVNYISLFSFKFRVLGLSFGQPTLNEKILTYTYTHTCVCIKFIPFFRALVRVLYVVVIIDFLSRLFLFFRLAEDNIDFVVLTGSENGDFVLHTFLNVGLQVLFFFLIRSYGLTCHLAGFHLRLLLIARVYSNCPVSLRQTFQGFGKSQLIVSWKYSLRQSNFSDMLLSTAQQGAHHIIFVFFLFGFFSEIDK